MTRKRNLLSHNTYFDKGLIKLKELAKSNSESKYVCQLTPKGIELNLF